ncbi:MAG: NAD(P)-binding protein [Gammaproteobacteria bacterium]
MADRGYRSGPRRADGVTRRDFVQGIALAGAAAGLPRPAAAQLLGFGSEEVYPPALTGLRGAHPGSFEVAHELALRGRRYPGAEPADEGRIHDLIVVGGGLSGLAAAWFYRREAGEFARILVLDNHDDFGGHAKRNEFRVAGRTLVGYGGSQSIDTPSAWSASARSLLDGLGVNLDRFYSAYDRGHRERFGLAHGIFFTEAPEGERLVRTDGARSANRLPIGDDAEAWVRSLPIADADKVTLFRILIAPPEELPAASRPTLEKILRRMSYNDYLRRYFDAGPAVIALFQNSSNAFWGIGTDALSALEAVRMGYPGFTSLNVGACNVSGAYESCEYDEPYIFHFPDGNASLARLLVRDLVPGAAPGDDMEDIVTARFDYEALDTPESRVRVRLNATVVRVVNRTLEPGREGVEVDYVTEEGVFRVRARHAILACNNRMIPPVCPELPPEQAQAIGRIPRAPLVYVNAAIENWQAFAELGLASAYFPTEFYHDIALDFPVSLGRYRYPSTPDEPMLLHLVHVPTTPESGLTPGEQFDRGRYKLLNMGFEDFERPLRRQLDALLGPAGFSSERDLRAITVNRWPHGYAYEKNDLFDPDWPPGEAPWEIGRRPFGRIAIAASDSEGRAYADGAIDAAWRAVGETIGHAGAGDGRRVATGD